MLIEYWKDICENNYEVSNFGQIRNKKTGRILKLRIRPKGYKEVKINKKSYSVHRLVAIAFIPNPNNHPQINHKNKLGGDNFVLNLEWCTNEYNMEHARAKTYYFRDSFGNVHEAFNLNKFCRMHELPVGNMQRLWIGKHKQIKGWTKASSEDFL